jgi:DnaJ-class molecular chaperone
MPTDQPGPAARLAVELSGIADRYPQLAGHGGRIDRARQHLEAMRQREKRLEALVRELGRCHWCNGSGKHHGASRPDAPPCDHCAGTGLVEAERKEIENG